MPPAPLAPEEKETGRVEAFSDGVFAIAITLLVLNLTIPQYLSLNPPQSGKHLTLLAYLGQHWTVYAAYAVSFLTVLVVWISHHNLMRHIKRIDHLFLLLNGVLLMFVTVVPFPTGLLAEFLGHPADATTAVVIYSATFFLITSLFNVVWWYAYRNQRLVDLRYDFSRNTRVPSRYVIGSLFYLVALGMAFLNITVSMIIFLALTVFYALPPPAKVLKPAV